MNLLEINLGSGVKECVRGFMMTSSQCIYKWSVSHGYFIMLEKTSSPVQSGSSTFMSYLALATEGADVSFSFAGFFTSFVSEGLPSTIDNISRIRRSWSA